MHMPKAINGLIQVGTMLDMRREYLRTPAKWTPCPAHMLSFKEKFKMPSFTAKHYQAIADLMHQERKKAIDMPELVGNGITRNVRLEQINAITLSFCKLFQADNPKFKQMTFIAACNRDLVE
jgi:hypothetical protein